METKILSDAEQISLRRLRAKKVPYSDIADRFGMTVPQLKTAIKRCNKNAVNSQYWLDNYDTSPLPKSNNS